MHRTVLPVALLSILKFALQQSRLSAREYIVLVVDVQYKPVLATMLTTPFELLLIPARVIFKGEGNAPFMLLALQLKRSVFNSVSVGNR
jgi:hypothetical protein